MTSEVSSESAPRAATAASSTPPTASDAAPPSAAPHGHFWLWVMCLTGVDYFSTLGYQPSIAFEATGRLAPLATLVLVAVTLLGALPVYRHVAGQSFDGQGSIGMLEHLLSGWMGKLLVLVLLGFAATDFVITKTLSAADAAEHLIHNPLWKTLPEFARGQVSLTMLLLVLLGSLFLRGFREVIGIAVGIVALYLTLNLVVIGSGLWHVATHPDILSLWIEQVRTGDWALAEAPIDGRGLGSMILVCLLLFPKLALGLSGFETGVAVMPLVAGDPDDSSARPTGRIRNTRKLLATAAVTMSLLLIGSSLVTSLLIPAEELALGGRAANRALAYLAHGQSPHAINSWFGEWFGTLFDMSTVAILWFAGASAMSGLLNLVPKYLPRFGMAPEWATAVRTLVLLLTGVNLFVTWIFKADVAAQSAAYATGVMMLMTSAAAAIVIERSRAASQRNATAGRFARLVRYPWPYVLILAGFVYTTAAIVVERPEGTLISGCFIGAVLLLSLASRLGRNMELRFDGFDFVSHESRMLWDTMRFLEFPVLVPHRPGRHSLAEKEASIRIRHRLTDDVPIVFIEASVEDASEFRQRPLLEIAQEAERFIIRVTRCVSIAHVIAAIALELSKTGRPPELRFGWSDENPLQTNLRFLLFGEGNVPWLVRQLLIRAEPDSDRRPNVFIG